MTLAFLKLIINITPGPCDHYVCNNNVKTNFILTKSSVKLKL